MFNLLFTQNTIENREARQEDIISKKRSPVLQCRFWFALSSASHDSYVMLNVSLDLYLDAASHGCTLLSVFIFSQRHEA